MKKIVIKEDVEYLVGWLVILILGFLGVDIFNVVNEVVFIGKLFVLVLSKVLLINC